MTSEIKDGHILVTAREGYFLANEGKSIYGVSLSLGTNDSPDNYSEYPMSEYPQQEEDTIEQ